MNYFNLLDLGAKLQVLFVPNKIWRAPKSKHGKKKWQHKY
ncbi:Protein of unknown function [Lactobacillus gigeriorum DSM 23908 = CRBIP 24.85]|uniref:Uncharacterized protein n=1 Tax=Lactobacillus gigeriorum DSM 23908 = CRBIP 24.85 TaxID=1423751 RepID=I7LD92_9LACO|nr:Protein of unknown function [Lactobacillus gigeriorum DSM 23908 = CRBIP 24.85]